MTTEQWPTETCIAQTVNYLLETEGGKFLVSRQSLFRNWGTIIFSRNGRTPTTHCLDRPKTGPRS